MLNVVYEDNHLIVVEKPCNVPVQADKTGDVDLLTMVKDYIKEKYNKTGNVYVGLVHRLDRPVGGIMVFAKTSKSASRLSESIRTNNFKKIYLAIVNNSSLKLKEKYEDYMIKNEALNKSMVCPKTKKGSKLAKLSYEIIDTRDDLNITNFSKISLVKINLETGRHHQIRVQFSSRGNYLYGDQKYGKGPMNTQIALWAYRVTFKHPTKDEVLTFECMPKPIGIWEEFKNCF